MKELEVELSLEEIEKFAKLPMSCVMKQYPNKLNQVLGDATYLKSPKELHPAFYGCFDWHSAVHGHWTMVYILKNYPKVNGAEEMKKMLTANINPTNIENELKYFDDVHNKNYERTYGWAWLLKLAEELHTWEEPLARELEDALQPMTEMIADKYIAFLPKLIYPIRVGEHTNTAFGLSFAYDYARTVNHNALRSAIEARAKAYYTDDVGCPIKWEPSGYDFLSPCLEEAYLMSKLLRRDEFSVWLGTFLPELANGSLTLNPAQVSDRSDGKLVHLDGLNFSRAWCLYGISDALGGDQKLKSMANEHINHSINNLVGDDYEGGHWLGSFAMYALKQSDVTK